MGKIKEIRLPKSIKWISLYAFQYVQDGKTINIPGKVKTKLEDTSLTDVKWRKVSLSSGNKEYKLTNGCLCSKDGKTMYGIIEDHKTITIPEGIETISGRDDYSGPDVIKIPASVTKIEKDATCHVLNTINPVKIQVSEDNKIFAVKDGSVYDKTTGKLIAGDIKDGVLEIPDTVRTVEYPGFLGNIETLQKVIITESVTAINYFDRDSNFGSFNLTLVFEGRIPPKIEDWYLLCDSKVYVPKGCEKIYRKEWEEGLRECGYSCSYEEMDHF